MSSYRFGDTYKAYVHPNVWELQSTTGPDRLVLAPASGFLSLMSRLADAMPEPYYVLHVLLVSRRGNERGRYQSATPWSRAQLRSFLHEFGPYLENDGRHHTWIMSEADDSQIVYDNHNLLYCYGPLAEFIAIAEASGLKEGRTGIPAPHQHRYNVEFDDSEERLLRELAWKHFPLMDDDDP